MLSILRVKNLSSQDIRALKFGLIAALAIVLFAFFATWFEHWKVVRESLSAKRSLLNSVNMAETKRRGLESIVPAFEMPESQSEQEFLFRDKFSEQLKNAGVRSEPLQIVSSSRSSRSAGYRVVYLKSRCLRCKFGQIVGLLASLKENPYLAGVEELRIKADSKQPAEFELNLTVSTFVK